MVALVPLKFMKHHITVNTMLISFEISDQSIKCLCIFNSCVYCVKNENPLLHQDLMLFYGT